ncbi:MAG: hypothetical protein U0R80_03850 [Nocardioidaceae bacterium]
MRATLDKLISWTGLLLAVVLLVAGVLLTWASNFASDSVSQQLADQHITMPEGDALATPDMKSALGKYAGQKMTTGEQAKAYADHYILAHLNETADGKTYSEVSGAYIGGGCTDPAKASDETCQTLGAQRQTLFMGSTLRGLLLNAYAFGTIAKIAMIAAIASFVGAALMLLLGLLGLSHAKKASVADESWADKAAVATS